MEYIVYIYANKVQTPELRAFRCPTCGRIVFKHNANRMELSNVFGVSIKDLTPGMRDDNNVPIFTEHKCHSCKSVFKIMYQ